MEFNFKIKNLKEIYINKDLYLEIHCCVLSSINELKELYIGLEKTNLSKVKINYLNPNRKEFKTKIKATDADNFIFFVCRNEKNELLTGKINTKSGEIKSFDDRNIETFINLNEIQPKPYVKTIINKKIVTNSDTEENIILLLEIENDEPIKNSLLNYLESIEHIFKKIFIICSKTKFEKFFSEKKYVNVNNKLNILRNFEIILKNNNVKNILYTNSKIRIDNDLIENFKKFNIQNNCVYIPKIINKSGKIIAAGSTIINNELVMDYGMGGDKNLSIFNFEKHLLATSNKAIFFNKEILKKAYHYGEEKFDKMKTFELFNFLSKYNNLNIKYDPKLEVVSESNNKPFYFSETCLSSNSGFDTIDARKKLIIFAKNKRLPFLKNYISKLINENYFITLVTDSIDSINTGILSEIIDKIEVIDNLNSEETLNLFLSRKESYLGVWSLDHKSLNLLKNHIKDLKSIFTPNLSKIKLFEYIVAKEILYSNLNYDDLNQEIIINENQEIYSLNELRKINNTTILCDSFEIADFLNKNKIYCEYLNYFNLDKTLVENVKNNKHLIQQQFKNSPEVKFIDIVVPVNNSLESLKNCINSLFKSCDVNFNLYLVNDAVESSAVKDFLVGIKKREGKNLNSKIFLIENKYKLGHLNSLNFCFTLCKNDILLINSDYTLPKNLKNIMGSDSNYEIDMEKTENPPVYSNKINYINSLVQELTPDKKIDLQNKIGFCLGVPKNTIEQINN